MDVPRLSEIVAALDRLSAQDRAVLEPAALPRWLRRRRRLAARDAAIATALQYFPDRRLTGAATALHRALAAYQAAGWRWECALRELPDAGGRHQALHAILRANKGVVVGRRRLVDIIGKCNAIFTAGNCTGAVLGPGHAVAPLEIARSDVDRPPAARGPAGL
jgi:hypothetical protein